MTIEGARLAIIKKYIEYTKNIRKKQIKNHDFTIISNNCWAGKIYQSYGLEYRTPTIGLFIMSDDYIKFIYNIKEYMKKKITFISSNESKYKEHFQKWDKFGKYPIGKIDDIEIHFLHYKSEKEANEKWERRKKRINWNNILFKFNDQNLCTKEHLEKFSELDVKNKICFTTKKYQFGNIIQIKSAEKFNEIPASYEPFGKSKYINVNKLIDEL